MRFFSYVISRDFGFAPNPFFDICTLATCKPQIRRSAQIGDWIAGFGGKCTPVYEKLVYIMHVSEKMTFDQYWNDIRFENKKPDFLKSLMYYYGDNIYHHDINTGMWLQENSHHSNEEEINYINLNKDTGADAVLISDKYWYFGSNACILPADFNSVVSYGRPYKKIENEDIVSGLIRWLSVNFNEKINGRPFDWTSGFKRYNGK